MAADARDRIAALVEGFYAAAWPRYRALLEDSERAVDGPNTGPRGRTEDADRRCERTAKRYAALVACRALHAVGREHRRGRGGDAPPASDDLLDRVRPSGDEAFAAVPADDGTRDRLRELVAGLRDEPLDRAGPPPDAMYEALLSGDERRELGRFYTPTDIAAAVCRWAIRSGDERVLDPAAGAGTFAVAAHDRLCDLAGGVVSAERVAAVDVDAAALGLTAFALTDRGTPRTIEASFFDLEPGDGRLGGAVDAVVGNPPYIRQEELDDAAHFRDHLSAFGSGNSPYLDGADRVSRRSDAYVYFVTHATRFLRDGGRLGFVVPAKWTATRYGESFRRFLYDHYSIGAVVGFDARAFDDALVDASLLLLERHSREETRRENTVNFVRITDPMDPGAVVAAVEADHAVPAGDHMAVHEYGTHRTVAVDQGYLVDEEPRTLAPHLTAPAEFIRLLAHPGLVPLDDLGAVQRGVMTGANDFFFLDGSDAAAIHDRFLTPAIKGLRDVDDRVVTRSDVERYLFDAHEYVQQVAGETAPDGRRTSPDGGGESPDGQNGILERRVKRALARDGYDGARRRVEWGESEGFHERRSCASRAVWFDLGSLDAPDLLHPKFFDERAFVVWNPDGVVPGNAIDCVSVEPAVDAAAVRGVLDSTLGRALAECWGRTEGGGALQLMTYEVASRPVVDVRRLDPETRARIVDAHRAIDDDPDAQDRLDRAVLDALDCDLDVGRLQARYEAMVRTRVNRGGTSEVLVGDDHAR